MYYRNIIIIIITIVVIIINVDILHHIQGCLNAGEEENGNG